MMTPPDTPSVVHDGMIFILLVSVVVVPVFIYTHLTSEAEVREGWRQKCNNELQETNTTMNSNNTTKWVEYCVDAKQRRTL